ncbi:hypothetical protein CEI69_22985 [Salmonella enterica subsp. enterica serovar Typhimurium]|nr:hypothetical protein [Salmonella enterica subsp. enterica serovar Typhimurium]TFN19656.1 hypothetical protein ELX75_23000 [Escherichia coli]TFN86412.1 hypothetical protein ELX91_25420 [Escherichia coli]TFN88890.1 hypothetical protein ELX91_22490 [Escherichia coli]TFQ67576.1 hypothetical protein ELU85_23215 [Escherichia coli]
MPDGRRRKNLSATKSGHMQRRFYSQAQCHIWHNQCRHSATYGTINAGTVPHMAQSMQDRQSWSKC